VIGADGVQLLLGADPFFPKIVVPALAPDPNPSRGVLRNRGNPLQAFLLGIGFTVDGREFQSVLQ